MSVILTSIPDCLHSGNPIIQVTGLKGMTSVDQVTSDGFDYYYDKNFFISLRDLDHDRVENLQDI